MDLRNLVSHPITMCTLVLAWCLPSSGTSVQTELPQPAVELTGRQIHGTVSYGLALGSDVYDTVGNLSAIYPLGNIDNGRIYFRGGILTWVDNPEFTQFDPKRIVYTIEPGYYWERGNSGYRFFITHQSFHDVDFSDGLDESYELYGFSYSGLGNPRYSLSIGNYLNRRVVDYDWDLAASVTYALSPPGGKDPYFHLWLHHVTESDGQINRDGFTDYAAELGLRYVSGIILFTRYEFLHDIDRFAGTSDHHVLTGIKYEW